MTTELGATCRLAGQDDPGIEGLAADSPSADAPYDSDELLYRCLGNQELARRVLRKFHSNFAGELSRMEACCEAGDLEEVKRLAHRLRGSAANVAARELSRLAAELEQLAGLGLHMRVSQTLAALERQWHCFKSFVGEA